MSDLIKSALQDSASLLQTVIDNDDMMTGVSAIAADIVSTFQAGGKVLIAGNGGSACDAMHFAEEFTGRFRNDRDPLPVMALTDPGHITCVANDYGFEHIFDRSVDAFGKSGDIFIGLSTSGNSQNVINAMNMAAKKDMTTIAFLGKDGGKLRGQCDHEIIIPGKTADRIQEVHMAILHAIIEAVEASL